MAGKGSSKKNRSRDLVLLLLTSGFFFAGILFDFMPSIIDQRIKRTLELATNEEIKLLWSKPPMEFNSYYWLYDIENPDELEKLKQNNSFHVPSRDYTTRTGSQFQAGEKPRLRKVGPYHFVLTQELCANLVPLTGSWRHEKRVLELSANKYRIWYNSTRLIFLDESFQQQRPLSTAEPSDGGQAPVGAGGFDAGREWTGNAVNLNASSSGPGRSSSARLDDYITAVNPIYVSLVAGIRDALAADENQEASTKSLMVATANRLSERFNETVLMRTTPRELLAGRPAPILDKLRKMAETFGAESRIPASLRVATSAKGPARFGLVLMQNNTWQGPFEVYTGFGPSAESLGELVSYETKRRLTLYSGKCNRLQASAGELRPMPLAMGQPLEMFMPLVCRIVHLQPTGSRRLAEGEALSYVLAPSDLASARTNPDKRCFCSNYSTTSQTSVAASTTPANLSSASASSSSLEQLEGAANWTGSSERPPREDHCSLEGALELAPCTYGAPLVLTFGHVQPDERILNSLADFGVDQLDTQVEGLSGPDNQAQMLLLRRLGMPVAADVSSTIFLKLRRDPQFRLTENLPEETYLPLVTVREKVSIPAKLAKIIVNLEAFVALTAHLKLVMYMTTILALCWLTGRHYSRVATRGRDFSGRRRQARGGASETPASGVASESGSGKPAATSGRKRRCWLERASTRIPRALGALKATLDEAGRLELEPRADADQDRRLELLAGRIGSWHASGSPPPASNQSEPAADELEAADRAASPALEHNGARANTDGADNSGDKAAPGGSDSGLVAGRPHEPEVVPEVARPQS